MNKPACPDDYQLWPAVMGDSIDSKLQTHLEVCLDCQRRVQSLRGDVDAVRRTLSGNDKESDSSPPVSLRLPPTIGEYTILSRLGSGGQADVYRARHPRLNTDVVIKWFLEDSSPNTEPSQLAAEALILSTIRHPYLGQVFDIGKEKGRPFIVMEYISGLTFSTWMRRFQPSIPRIASVLANAARAVDAVHQHGALHLDLKPGNILVDAEGVPRVIDFGMARIQGSGSQRSLRLAPGTPEFMSPEQCVGDTGRISAASDVYGLGAVLFSALSGATIRSEDHVSLEPDWSLIRRAPWSLRRICHKALATRPQDRYESALDLALALEQFATRQSIRRRVASVALVLAGVATCFAGVVTRISTLPVAILEIDSQRCWETAQQVVYEKRCSAILSNRRIPCLVVATAKSQPVCISPTTHEEDADERITHLHDKGASIQIADNAGPHLILACSRREWDHSPPRLLPELLASLHTLSVEHPVEFLIHEGQVILIPDGSHVCTPQELQHQQIAFATVTKIQAVLDTTLHGYSGIVVIPKSAVLVASAP